MNSDIAKDSRDILLTNLSIISTFYTIIDIYTI